MRTVNPSGRYEVAAPRAGPEGQDRLPQVSPQRGGCAQPRTENPRILALREVRLHLLDAARSLATGVVVEACELPQHYAAFRSNLQHFYYWISLDTRLEWSRREKNKPRPSFDHGVCPCPRTNGPA